MTDPVNSDAALVLLDVLCRDSLESPLATVREHRDGAIAMSFAELADEINRLAAAAERADEAEARVRELEVSKTYLVDRAERAEAALLAAQQERDEARDMCNWIAEGAKSECERAEATNTRLREALEQIAAGGVSGAVVAVSALAQDAEQESA